MRLAHRHTLPAALRQTKQTLAPGLSLPYTNQTLLSEQPKRPRQRRAIHRKTRAQPLLIGLANLCQRCQQTELCDLQARFSQFLVVDPRYHPGEPAQVLTCARQLEKCVHRPFSKTLATLDVYTSTSIPLSSVMLTNISPDLPHWPFELPRDALVSSGIMCYALRHRSLHLEDPVGLRDYLFRLGIHLSRHPRRR